MSHIDSMKNSAKDFQSKIGNLGIITDGMSVSENLYGVSIYFKGVDRKGRVFNFRFSDHDCQRGSGAYEKVSPKSIDTWVFEYEKMEFPELFCWEYLEKYITKPNGETVQVKRLIGRK